MFSLLCYYFSTHHCKIVVQMVPIMNGPSNPKCSCSLSVISNTFLFMVANNSQSQYEKLLKNLVLQYWLLQLQLVAYQKKEYYVNEGAVYLKQHEVLKNLNNLRPKPYNLNLENPKKPLSEQCVKTSNNTSKNFLLKRFLMQYGPYS